MYGSSYGDGSSQWKQGKEECGGDFFSVVIAECNGSNFALVYLKDNCFAHYCFSLVYHGNSETKMFLSDLAADQDSVSEYSSCILDQ